MISTEIALVLVFAVAFAGTYLATFAARALAPRFGLLDRPRPGEVQSRIVPRGGGYAIFLGFFAASVLGALLVPRSPEEEWRLAGVLLGAVVLLPIAYLDDRRRLAPAPQLLAQIAVALIPLFFGIVVDSIATPFWGVIPLPYLLIGPFTIFWIVGMINTLNLVDVMDGLASGVAAIAALVLFARGVFEFGQSDIAILPLALAGGCLGFLPHNYHPARIFMGSAGSMLLGYSLATMSIMGGAKVATALLVLGVPVANVAWVIVRRLVAGRSPFKGGDQLLLPQRLLLAGLSQRQVVGIFYLLCALFGLAAIGLTPAQKVIAFVALAVVMAAILFALARTERKVGSPTSRT